MITFALWLVPRDSIMAQDLRDERKS